MPDKKKSKIKKTDLPSKYIESRISKIEKDAIEKLVKEQDITKKEAQEILGSSEEFVQYMATAERAIKLQMMADVLPKIQEAVETKLEHGSLTQAQKGMTAWAIAKDKIFGENKASMNIGGKNIQINFDFKPYKKK